MTKKFNIWPEPSGKPQPTQQSIWMDKHTHPVELFLPIGGRRYFSYPIAKLMHDLTSIKFMHIEETGKPNEEKVRLEERQD